MKPGIAFNPETKILQHKDALVHADIALVMTVYPGWSGQEMIEKPLTKIDEIRRINPTITIGVDGGVNLANCKMVSNFKTDWAVATNAIQKTKRPRKAYEELMKKSKTKKEAQCDSKQTR